MEPKQYLNILRRWSWVIALGLVVGLGAGLVFSRFQEPVYSATTRVLVTPSTGSDLVSSNQNLADTYAQLILARPVIDGTSERLGYTVRAGQVTVQRVIDAEIVLVTVEDGDPTRAADIANTLVEVFLEQNASLQESRYSESEESLRNQIARVEEQMNTLQEEMTSLTEEGFDSQQQAVTAIIANLQNERDTLNLEIDRLQFDRAVVQGIDPSTGRYAQMTATPPLEQRQELSAAQARLTEIESLLTMYQEIYVNLSVAGDSSQTQSSRSDRISAAMALYSQLYSNLVTNLEQIRLARFQSAPNILQVEEAAPNPRPVRPNPVINMAFGSILGLLLSVGVVVLAETMDNTLRSPEEVMDLLQVPVLGYIAEMDEDTSRDKNAVQAPYVLKHPRSPVAEAFRSLRTNLQFTELDKPLATLLVSSQGVAEGKTTVAVNLAVVMAQMGRRVILVDADLRRPRVHHELGLSNRTGLSNLLHEHLNPTQVMQRYRSDTLMVITSGGLPPNPAEVLSSRRMAEVLTELASISDMVILDGPPLVFADSIALGASVDGVLMVVRPNRTGAQEAVVVVEQLQRVGARLLGVVLNWVSQSASHYYGHYKTYARYAVDGAEDLEPVDSDNSRETTQPVRVRK